MAERFEAHEGQAGGRKGAQAASRHAPSAATLVRLVGTAGALVVLSGVFLALGWWVAGVIAALLCAGMVVLCVAIGHFFVRFALKAGSHAMLGPRKRGGELAYGDKGATPRQGDDDGACPRDERHSSEIDEAVGFILREDDIFSNAAGDLDEQARATMVANRHEERELTYAWLQSLPEAAVRDVSVEAQDGVVLAGHVIATHPESGRWVVFLHGYAGRWREMMLYARRWALEGFNLLFVEMRGHGASGGRYVGLGWLDRRDVVSWVRWLVGEYGEGVRVALHGHSMGGAAVCMSVGEADLPEQVRLAVSDCAFTSAWDACSCLLEGQMGLPEHPIMDLTRLNFMARKGGFDLARADGVASVARARVPMVFAHGGRDAVVPVWMAHELYDACASEKVLVEVPGAGHCQSALVDPDAYFGTILSWADRFLR